jgi:hypothetical protein
MKKLYVLFSSTPSTNGVLPSLPSFLPSSYCPLFLPAIFRSPLLIFSSFPSFSCPLFLGGTVSYNEFLVGIRGTLGPRRKALVQLAFDVLDKDGSGNF